MFDYKFDKSLNELYESIKQASLEEPSLEDIVDDVKPTPKKYLKKVLESEDIKDILTKYVEEVNDEDADLGILVTSLSQIINKTKDKKKDG